jgi:protein-disulfide isomerase
LLVGPYRFSLDCTIVSMSLFCTKRRPALFVLAAAAVLLLVGAGPRTAAAQCQLDASKSPVENDGAALVNFQDITKGSGASGVTVIEYFDPNCPHCKDFHQTMKKVVADHREDVRFVYKPFPLRRSSLPEVQALYVAACAAGAQWHFNERSPCGGVGHWNGSHGARQPD